MIYKGQLASAKEGIQVLHAVGVGVGVKTSRRKSSTAIKRPSSARSHAIAVADKNVHACTEGLKCSFQAQTNDNMHGRRVQFRELVIGFIPLRKKR